MHEVANNSLQDHRQTVMVDKLSPLLGLEMSLRQRKELQDIHAPLQHPRAPAGARTGSQPSASLSLYHVNRHASVSGARAGMHLL